MTPEESHELRPGLYRVFWVSGRYSLASVGIMHDETRWFAPANWTSGSEPFMASTDWSAVFRVERILSVGEDRRIAPSKAESKAPARLLLERLGLCPDSELVERILAALRRNHMLDEDLDPQKHVRRTFDDAISCAQTIVNDTAGGGGKGRGVALLEAAVSLGEMLDDVEAVRLAKDCLKRARLSFRGVCPVCGQPMVERSHVDGRRVVETSRQGATGRIVRGPVGRANWVENAAQFLAIAQRCSGGNEPEEHATGRQYMVPSCPGCNEPFRSPETDDLLSLRPGQMAICSRCQMALVLVATGDGSVRWYVHSDDQS